ncbi:MAG: hypothetical protein HRU50_15785 [Winogradskyella sp.]|uniref:hypothetical protein n=1 Tax=Winogradskyella sp. TaxID=1883156 RepID=UPI0025D55C05|nr:hypothetical protein [Winogradskyella sp.]NRB61381.1 hypothetical protein [Winogradskyella sp.]
MRRLLFDNLKVVGLMIVIVPFYYMWKNGTDFVLEEFWIWFIIGFTIITNIPAVILYLNYYFENRNTEFTLDYEQLKISITKDGVNKIYQKNEIERSTYHLGIYYKNALDRGSRRPMLISDFGYWDIQFKNGDRYYLTNILHDFLHQTPLFVKTRHRFRIYPYINKKDTRIGINLLEKPKKEKTLTEKFTEQYQSKNERQLREIIDNKKSYQKEAVEAAEIVLKKKTLGNNGYN